MAFGVKSVYGESAGSLLPNYPTSELMQWKHDHQESVYASTKREPLGKSFNRGHALPEKFADQVHGAAFGVEGEVKPTSSQVKDLVFPLDSVATAGDEDDSEAHKMYVKTHGNYAPGEQRRRGYDWKGTGLDPNTATFGGVDKEMYQDGVAKAINPQRDQTQKAGVATIVGKRLEDFKSTNNDELGRVKNLGHGEKPTVGPDHVYGVPSRKFVEWGAGRLISGNYTEEEQAPDPDLGKSLRQGYRNLPEEMDPDRAFGVPCIRSDLPPRDLNTKSVADNTNYGNEANAVTLIFPSAGADRGVVEGDYVKPYDKTEMQNFYASTGIPMDQAEFDATFETACELDGGAIGAGGGDTCTIQTFQRVRMYNLSAAVQQN